MKFRAHKRLFRALDTIVSRKFRHWPISLKVRGNTACTHIKLFVKKIAS